MTSASLLTDVPLEHLQRVHRALRITVPLETASPLLLSTLTAIAHCWRDHIPDNLFPDAPRASLPESDFYRYSAPLERIRFDSQPRLPQDQFIDLKRRAAGDED